MTTLEKVYVLNPTDDMKESANEITLDSILETNVQIFDDTNVGTSPKSNTALDIEAENGIAATNIETEIVDKSKERNDLNVEKSSKSKTVLDIEVENGIAASNIETEIVDKSKKRTNDSQSNVF